MAAPLALLLAVFVCAANVGRPARAALGTMFGALSPQSRATLAGYLNGVTDAAPRGAQPATTGTSGEEIQAALSVYLARADDPDQAAWATERLVEAFAFAGPQLAPAYRQRVVKQISEAAAQLPPGLADRIKDRSAAILGELNLGQAAVSGELGARDPALTRAATLKHSIRPGVRPPEQAFEREHADLFSHLINTDAALDDPKRSAYFYDQPPGAVITRLGTGYMGGVVYKVEPGDGQPPFARKIYRSDVELTNDAAALKLMAPLSVPGFEFVRVIDRPRPIPHAVDLTLAVGKPVTPAAFRDKNSAYWGALRDFEKRLRAHAASTGAFKVKRANVETAFTLELPDGRSINLNLHEDNLLEKPSGGFVVFDPY